MQARHRKNAAEWVMYIVLYPLARIAALVRRHGGEPDGRSRG